jgi:hypothetical protein
MLKTKKGALCAFLFLSLFLLLFITALMRELEALRSQY